jgi:serine phosphatase RsbU (regulator of sigma subunit)
MLRLINQSFLEDASPPNRLLHRMNQALCRVSRESDLLVFATACALTLDLKNGTLRFASAGHPPPVVLPADGSPPLPLGTERQRRPALGIFPDAVYSVHEEKLRGNDKVLLFTDGIFDVENAAGQFLTPESLWREASRQAHLPLQGILDALLAYLEKFSGLQAFPDDVCMLGLQIEPFPRRAA